jgi:hypothetical protein
MIHNQVEQILRDEPKTRDSDKLLLLKVWEEYGLYLSEAQKDKFLHAPSSETVRRVRQKIQEQGKYPANHLISRHRRFKSLQMQQITPHATPKYIEQTLL